jgi:hypothetical protein
MKNMYESAETFTAYATIDAGYYMISKIQKETAMAEHPINDAIDRITGYDKKKNNDTKDEVILILKDIIKAKKVIGADYLKDQEMINELNAL